MAKNPKPKEDEVKLDSAPKGDEAQEAAPNNAEPSVTEQKPEETAPPAAELEPQVEAVTVEAVQETEAMVWVTPRKSVPTCRIGNDYYSFLQGKRVKVPVGVRAHLVEKGIV